VDTTEDPKQRRFHVQDPKINRASHCGEVRHCGVVPYTKFEGDVYQNIYNSQYAVRSYVCEQPQQRTDPLCYIQKRYQIIHRMRKRTKKQRFQTKQN
jgi:hypothetical protein